MRKTIFGRIQLKHNLKQRRMERKGKAQCEYCLKYFKKEELDELISAQEKICKRCLIELEKIDYSNDPEPFSI